MGSSVFGDPALFHPSHPRFAFKSDSVTLDRRQETSDGSADAAAAAGSDASSSSSSSSGDGSSTSTSAAPVDPCGITVASGAKLIWTVPEVLSCYSSFSLLTTVKNAQIDALKSNLQMHPYLDQMQSSKSPFYSANVDLLYELERIRADTSLTTELAFHARIVDLIKSLRDGHTSYDPQCFKAFLFFQPWIIAVKYPNGPTPVIYLKNVVQVAQAAAQSGSTDSTDIGASLVMYWKNAGVDVSKYVGWTVTKINGMDASSFVQQQANTDYGVSRVRDTRFNKMFPANMFVNGNWMVVDSSLYQQTFIRPNMPIVWQYELTPPPAGRFSDSAAASSSVLVTVPWGATPNPAYKTVLASRDSYYQAACVSPSLTAISNQTPPPTNSLLRSSSSPSSSNQPTSPNPAVALASSFHEASLENYPNQHTMSWHAERKPRVGWMNLDRPNYDVSLAISHAERLQASMASGSPWRVSAENEESGGGDGASSSSTTAEGTGASSTTTSAPISLASPLLKDSVNAFYDMGDGVTGVWVIASFQPPQVNAQTVAAWMATVTTGLTSLESRGLTKLIIDVSNNPGGLICGGQAFVKYLFPNMMYMHYDVKRTPLLTNLINTAFTKNDSDSFYSFLGSFQSNLNFGTTQVPVSQPSEVFRDDPAYTYNRGGILGNYTARVDMDCNDFIKNMTALPQLVRGGWQPRNVAVVSNGLCGSTCSNMVRVLRDQFKVKSFVYGGLGAGPFQPTSFEGGKMVRYSRVSSEIAAMLQANNGGTPATASPADTTSASRRRRRRRRDQSVSSNNLERRQPQQQSSSNGGAADAVMAVGESSDPDGIQNRWSALLGGFDINLGHLASPGSKGGSSSSSSSPGPRVAAAANANANVALNDDAPAAPAGDPAAAAGGSTPAAAAPSPTTGAYSINPMYVSSEGFIYPLPLARPAQASLPFWEGYSRFGPVTNTPMEWWPAPAEQLVVVPDPLDTVAIWTAVAKALVVT